MTRTAAITGTILFLLMPGVVAGLVPWWLNQWTTWGRFPGDRVVAVAGAILVAAGLALLLDCFARFAWSGRGTPAPIAPTETLVVGGPYRRVRNPMYVAVLVMIFGQAMMFASLATFVYGIVIFATVHAFVLLYEEPTLRQDHGAAYDAYAAAVPRWIPRLTPWRGAP